MFDEITRVLNHLLWLGAHALDIGAMSVFLYAFREREDLMDCYEAVSGTRMHATYYRPGGVIMYADKITKSMQFAIDETNRRRKIQEDYNSKNNIKPRSIVKEVRDITEKIKETNLNKSENQKIENISDKNINKLIKDLEKEMKNAAKILEFEKAALLRDQITELRKNLIDKKPAEEKK